MTDSRPLFFRIEQVHAQQENTVLSRKVQPERVLHEKSFSLCTRFLKGILQTNSARVLHKT